MSYMNTDASLLDLYNTCCQIGPTHTGAANSSGHASCDPAIGCVVPDILKEHFVPIFKS